MEEWRRKTYLMTPYVSAYRAAVHAGHGRIVEAFEEQGEVDVARVARTVVEQGGEHVARWTVEGAAEGGSRALWYVEALCEAACAGHTSIMRALVEEGQVDVGACSEVSFHPIQIYPFGMKLDSDADARKTNTALTNAAKHGRMEAARMLVAEWGAGVNQQATDKNDTPLIIAAHRGYLELARMLVFEYHADVNKATSLGATPLSRAAGEGHIEIVRMLVVEGNADVNNNIGNSPLKAALGHTELARFLVVEGKADVDKITGDWTPLHWSVQGGLIETARMLVLEGHADVDKATTDEWGETPLHMAANQGQIEMARMLVVEGKADVDMPSGDDGTTPLMAAAEEGHIELVRMLLVEGKADANKTDADECDTALHIAAICTPRRWSDDGLDPVMRQIEVIRSLVMEGNAQMDQPNRSGRKPIHYGQRDVKFALCALGADMNVLLPNSKSTNGYLDRDDFDGWIEYACRLGATLKVALERRDHDAAVLLLRNRKTDQPTAAFVRDELLPIATTVGTHVLALPVCPITVRVAEMAVELYSGARTCPRRPPLLWHRWSPKIHRFCGKLQQEAVMAVMMIMARRGQGQGQGGEEGLVGEGEGNQHAQVESLPGWMHGVPDDAWWKVLEMMGVWPANLRPVMPIRSILQFALMPPTPPPAPPRASMIWTVNGATT